MTAHLRKPGMVRAFFAAFLGVAVSYGLTILVRALYGHDTYSHFLDGEAVLQVALIASPLFFLVGLGAFDYWFYWARAGRPARGPLEPRRLQLEGLLPRRAADRRTPRHFRSIGRILTVSVAASMQPRADSMTPFGAPVVPDV